VILLVTSCSVSKVRQYTSKIYFSTSKFKESCNSSVLSIQFVFFRATHPEETTCNHGANSVGDVYSGSVVNITKVTWGNYAGN